MTTTQIDNRALVKAFSAILTMFDADQLYTANNMPAYDGIMVCESNERSVTVEYTIRVCKMDYTNEDGRIVSGYDTFAANLSAYAVMLHAARGVTVESYNMGDYYTIVLSIPYDRDLPFDYWHE